MFYISRYKAPKFGVLKKNYFIKWVNFDRVLMYVPVKLEQIPGDILKAETISNEQFFIRMDLTQFLHGVNLI